MKSNEMKEKKFLLNFQIIFFVMCHVTIVIAGTLSEILHV